jgi:nicotinate phosphoribosyltransferase
MGSRDWDPPDGEWVILHGDVGAPRLRPAGTVTAGGARPPALLLDLYELTMAQSYFDRGMAAPATFSLFARRLPPGWGYFLAAGLDDVLAYLEGLAFGPEDLAYLRTTGLFTDAFLAALGRLRFTGSVRALPEGTVCFPDEPLLEVTAPLAEAQLVETVVLNQVHLQTLVASKAARCVRAAGGRRLVDFGLRRTHGADAGMKVARCAYLAGFAATSNVAAGQRYGVPVTGTMAHSYVQAFGDELAAFRAYARRYPDACTLLIDTYDTVAGAKRAAVVGQELAAAGHRLRGVRLDSGDLLGLSVAVRAVLDRAGLRDAAVFASGGLDERSIAAAVAAGAPIDAFGVGSRLGTVADAPYLDMAYKLVAYAGRPTLKLSAGKATWPGAKQVWRLAAGGRHLLDWLGCSEEAGPASGHPLLAPVMVGGRRLVPQSPAAALAAARERARTELARLPLAALDLEATDTVAVRVTPALERLRGQLVAEIRAVPAAPEPAAAGSPSGRR